MYTTGHICRRKGNQVLILAELPNDWIIDKQKIETVGVFVDDGRQMSGEQRKKIYALLGEISEWNGDVVDALQQQMKLAFIASEIGSGKGDIDWFSLSPRSPVAADMSTAKRFITFLIDFCLEHGIPTKVSLLKHAEDIGRYLYACIIHLKCCLCQSPNADLHHCDAVGMGRNRDEISHIGMRAMALCREHHTEAHFIGQKAFDAKHHVYGIKIDEYLAKELKLGKYREEDAK